jgi:hypothetical protein
MLCKDECSFDATGPSDKDLKLLFEIIMAENNLQVPNDYESAKNLYMELRNKTCEALNDN